MKNTCYLILLIVLLVFCGSEATAYNDTSQVKSGFDLGSASIDAIIMLFLKWLLDLISEKKKHALELKKRYFDKNMDVTLTTLNTHYFMLSQAKSSLNLIE